MGQDSKIEWTDHTFNPWIGCTKVSPGCLNCYAETRMDSRYGRVKWGKGQPRSRTGADNWRKPKQWNANAAAFPWICPACNCRIADDAYESDPCFECSNCHRARLIPYRPRVFCASLADWLDDEVPIEWLADLLELIAATPNLDWLLLTKRPQNFAPRTLAVSELRGRPASLLAMQWGGWGNIPPNVWVGTSAEDQNRWDERMPLLMDIPACIHFVSAEPLLGPIVMNGGPRPDWLIVGGESGPGARPMHTDWARSLRDQCVAAGVAFHFKQWGEYSPEEPPDGRSPDWPGGMWRTGKKAAGRELDGRTWDELPSPQLL